MKDLTSEQQIIVNKLVNEFTKLNDKPKDGEFSILNFNDLNAEIIKRNLFIKELKAHNDSMNALILETTKDIAKKIVGDIKKGNLPLIVDWDANSISISSANERSSVSIYLAKVTVATKYGDRIDEYRITPFSSTNASTFRTIEELFENKYFKDQLLNLIK